MDFDFEYDMYNPSAQARNETRKKRKCRFPRISEMPWQFITLSLLIIVLFGALLTVMLLRETPGPHEDCDDCHGDLGPHHDDGDVPPIHGGDTKTMAIRTPSAQDPLPENQEIGHNSNEPNKDLSL
ncbi:hypothetical protein QR680_010422 [Steinernema hermaphroditum]|uniref:Uncharacterized protein n=1 Tax=Steinernema hermaphroditum TaxID=289476 RepID=A0AA39INW9_9BILA|nr:hypothetical protein QR680_010422 [Steinernema hermaphroditum]